METKTTSLAGCLHNYYFPPNRSKSKKISPCMTKEEKALVKIAAEAPEQFDSNNKILQEAERAAAWVKSAKYCVVFTGQF